MNQLEEWNYRVEAAREHLYQDPHHDLSYSHVMGLVALYGPRLVVDHAHPVSWWVKDQDPLAVQGWQRRAWNALLCAEKAVRYCIPVTLAGEMKTLLLEARRVVVGRNPLLARFLQMPFSLEELLARFAQFPDYQSRKTTFDIHQITSTYHVIEHALSIVWCDVENHFHEDLFYEESQRSQHWKEPNASYASVTFGGYYTEERSYFADDNARHKFWLWWLDEALPVSWTLRYVYF